MSNFNRTVGPKFDSDGDPAMATIGFNFLFKQGCLIYADLLRSITTDMASPHSPYDVGDRSQSEQHIHQRPSIRELITEFGVGDDLTTKGFVLRLGVLALI